MTTTHTTLLSEAPGPSSPAHEKPSVTGTGALARSGRRAAPALLVALAALLALALPAQAQTVTTFVSNTGQERHASSLHVSYRSGISIAQGFRTGSNADGYTLNAIGIFVETSSIANSSEFTANIHAEAVGGGPAAAILYELTTPWPITASAVNNFLAPANATLAADTNYFVAFTGTKTLSDFALFVGITISDSEDSGVAENWSIENGYRDNGALTTPAALISVKGTVVGGTTLSTDATLSGLALKNASDDSTIDLNETFATGTKSYTAGVANDIDEITVEPASDNNATFAYLDASDTVLTDSDTLKTGFQVDLSVGANTIKVKVTAEDTMATDTYTVVVTRAMAATAPCPAVNDWCGKVTVALEGFSFGYEFDKFGLLDDNMIEYGGQEIEVWTVHVIPQLPRGLTYIYFGSIPRVPRGTVITLGDLTYTTDVVSDDGSLGDRWDFPEDGFPPGLDWSVGQEVRVSLVLGSFPAEGAVAISGTAQVGSTLTADPSGITDTDGLTTPTYTYQWLRVDADGVSNETTIGANAATYTLVAADVGKKIKVQVSFTDDRGHIETVTSDATVVAAPPGVTVSKSTLTVTEQSTTGDSYTVVLDSEPTANVVVTVAGHSGTDVTPVPTTLTFTDSDWATAKTVTVTAADDADTVDDEVSLTHSAMSTDTDYSGITIAGVTVTVDDNDDANTPATGQPAITGAAQVGKTLTAGLGMIADTDGLPGTFPDDYTLQWVRVDADGVSNEADISGETSGTYTPVAADVGKKIKVKVSFTDNGSTAEGPLLSAAYPSNAPVVAAVGACPAVNNWCTTLTVGFSEDPLFKFYGFSTAITDDGLADTTIDDGDGTTWTVSTMVIADAMINDQVHINLDAFLARGSVFDLGGTTFTTDETSESTVTTGNYSWLLPAGFAWVHGQDVTVSVKLPANAPATGVPEISGSPQVGETLSAGTTGIMDLDGLTSVSYTYQWLRVDADGMSNETPIGADAVTYTPVAADVGKKIKVRVSFTDDGGTGEDRTSNAFPASGTITAGTLPALSFASANITVNETAGTATLTVDLDPVSTGTVTVDFATSDVGTFSAHAGVDYTATSGTLTFAASETSKTITVPILNDTDYDPVQRFRVTLSNASGATLPTSPWANVNITNDDAMPTASIANVTVGEGAGTLTLTLALDRLSNMDISYSAVTAGVSGTATVADDYVAFLLLEGEVARITVPAGNLSQTFDITLVDDSVDEADETIVIVWTKFPSHDATPASITVTGTITDNDMAGVTLSKTLLTVTEEDTTGDSYSVVLNSQPTADVVVTVAGHSGTDVTPTPTTLTFTPINWETVQPVTVTAGTDMDTVNETVSLTHSAASTDANYNGITIGGVAVSVHDDDTGNNLATGKPAISGTAAQGETLTAAIGNIADTDGLPTTFPDDYTFQWVRVDADGTSNEADLSGETSGTYTPVAADAGKKVKVQVSFTDDGGTSETLTSDAYPSSGTITATPTVSMSADKTTAVFKEDDITYTLTRTGLTTFALPVTVALTQAKDFLLAADLSKTVTIAAGQSTKHLHGRGRQLPAFRGGHHGRERHADRGDRGRHRLRPGDDILGRCGHRDRRDSPVRDGVLHRGRGGLHHRGQADRAYRPGRAAADLEHQFPESQCGRWQCRRGHRLHFWLRRAKLHPL